MNRSGTPPLTKSERVSRIIKLQEELAALENNTNSLNEDQLEQLLFRMNNIGYSLKRIADSLGDIKRAVISDKKSE